MHAWWIYAFFGAVWLALLWASIWRQQAVPVWFLPAMLACEAAGDILKMLVALRWL